MLEKFLIDMSAKSINLYLLVPPFTHNFKSRKYILFTLFLARFTGLSIRSVINSKKINSKKTITQESINFFKYSPPPSLAQ